MSKAIFKLDEVRVINESEGNPGTITGYAAKFETLSVRLGWFKEKIRKGAFVKSLSRNNIKALWNHDTNLVLGSTAPGTLRLNEDDIGLKFELDLPNTQAGKDASISVTRGDVEGVSFGFNPEVQEWNESDPENVIRTLVEVDLHEISPTPFPAYLDTSVEARSIESDYNEYKKTKDDSDSEIRKRKLGLKLKQLEI